MKTYHEAKHEPIKAAREDTAPYYIICAVLIAFLILALNYILN
jgi:hypothetical protein